MVRIGIVFWLVLGLISVSGHSFAQTFNFNTRPRGIQLPVQNVLDIKQDTLGQLWFSTSRGVVFSDGIHTHTLPDSINRKFAYRIAILKDLDGIIWLYNATGSPVLVRGNANSWQEEKLNIPDPDGFSDRNRLFSVRKGREKLFFLDTKKELIFWKNDDQKQILARDQAEFGELLSVSEFGREIVMNFSNVTVIFQEGEFKPLEWKNSILPSPPAQIIQSPDGKDFFFLGKNYLFKGTNYDTPTEPIDVDFGSYDFNDEDFFGLQYVGNSIFYHFNSNLKKYNPIRKQLYQIEVFPLFQSPILQTFLVDREGILWLGTSRGLASNNSQLFQNYSSIPVGFLGNEVTAIQEINQGEYLLGFNNGIQKFSRNGISTVLKDEFLQDSPSGRIMNFSADGYGRVWFSRNLLGAGFLDKESGRVQELTSPAGVSFSSVQAYGDTLFLVGPRNIFIANLKSGLDKLFNSEITEEIKSYLGGVPVFFRKAMLLKNGKILILRASQLENKYPIIEKGGYILAEGYDAIELENGGLLIGTEGGLRVFQAGYVGYYQYGGQVITHPVFTLMKASDQSIWVGTDQGIFVLKDQQITHFKESNGLIGNEVNRGALIESWQGKVLIGTQKGMSIFSPDEDFFASGPPLLHIRSLTLGGDLVSGEGPIEVPFEKNFLQAELIATAFNESRDLWIHYRLIGGKGEQAWEITKNPESNQLFFSNLPSGSYQLQIQASYDGKDFSPIFTSPEIVILRPFYLRGWFLVLAVLFLIGMGILFARFYQQLKDLGLLQSRVEREQKSKNLAEIQFKNVWNNAQDPMLLTLEGVTVLTANPAFARMLGMPVKEIEGKLVFDFLKVTDEDRRGSSDVILNQIRNAGAVGLAVEGTFNWKNGPLDMEAYSVMVEEDFEGQALILSVFRDLSAQKSVQQRLQEAKDKAEEASRFKTSLLSNISHEIRTPLTGIIGGAEHIMMSRKEDEVLQSQLDIILQSGERLLSTINSLLDLAKIEANKMEVIYTPTKLNEFFPQLLKPLRKVAEMKRLEVIESIQCPDQLIPIDRRFMEMILNNLVGNAIKYSNKGVITVEIKLDKDQSLKIRIQDQGQGISEEFQKKMFEPFEQESTGNKRMFEGTGLGLAITKNLISLLQGKIEVRSKINEGTEVKLEIPLPKS